MSNQKYKHRDYIDREPVEGLEECLALSPKLESIALFYDLVGPDTPKEAPIHEELVARLYEEIPARFAKEIPYFSETEAALVTDLLSDCESASPPLEDWMPTGYRNLMDRGYCFIFHWEEQLRPVVPRELEPIWAEAVADEAVLSTQKRNRELLRYADALASLYGAYEVEQFAAVWNQHHRDKLTPEEAEAALLEIQQFDGCFWAEDGLVVNESIIDDEELEELLEGAADIPYYMPTKNVIALFADDSHYDEDRPELTKLKKFLTELEPEGAFRWFDLDFEIVMSCEEAWDGEQLVELLAGHGFPFEDNAAFEEFARLYRALWDNTRQWVLRGHTPTNYASEFGGARPDFRMPLPVSKSAKKVGRNEPCPCGSGKKYKKCCGR